MADSSRAPIKDVKPRYKEGARDRPNMFATRIFCYNLIMRFFYTCLLLLGLRISFIVIPRTSLSRGSLNRSSIVL